MPKKIVLKSRALLREEQAAHVAGHFDGKGRRVFQLVTPVNVDVLPGRVGKLKDVDPSYCTQLKLF